MITCCNQPIEIKSGKENGKNLFYAMCPTCNRKHKAEKKEEVERYFQTQSQVTNIYQLQNIPNKSDSIQNWFHSNMLALRQYIPEKRISKPETDKMLNTNVNYIIRKYNDPKFKKVITSESGLQSLTDAFGEALFMLATLGKMGDIIPFGDTAEFIENIECIKFNLEQGNNAPFSDIQIDLIHENDTTENYQEDGDFKIKIKRGIPRGEIIAVVPSGIRNDTGKRMGDIYDVDRLIAKAMQHSPAYKSYLKEKEEFKRLEVEGKLQTDPEGNKYYDKKIEYEKDGQKKSFIKKIYESDITNPYDGPDRPEMLRKAAGKSFFRPYMKVRNASAMAQEWQQEPIETREQAADHVLNRASQQFNDNIKDAEIIENDNNDVENNDNSNKNEKNDKNEKENLFDEE